MSTLDAKIRDYQANPSALPREELVQLLDALLADRDARIREKLAISPEPPLVRMGFVLAMENELQCNAYKGDWHQYQPANIPNAIAWMSDHTAKLILALSDRKPSKVTEHAADVASIVMKIEECYGATI